MQKLQHELKPEQGVSELSAFFGKITPSDAMFAQALPSMRKAVDATYLVFFSDTVVNIAFEAHFLGAVRYLHSGSMAFLMVDAVALSAEPKLVTERAVNAFKPLTLAEMQGWLSKLDGTALTKEAMTKLAPLKVYSVSISAGDTLVIPPGWLVASSVLS